MSSTTNPDQHRSPLRTVVSALFTITVVVFLLGGIAIVVGQAVELALGSSSGARAWVDHLALVAFGGASVAGLLAFLLTYGEKHQHDEDEVLDSDADPESAELAASHPARDAGR